MVSFCCSQQSEKKLEALQAKKECGCVVYVYMCAPCPQAKPRPLPMQPEADQKGALWIQHLKV